MPEPEPRVLGAGELDQVRPLLRELLAEDQRHYPGQRQEAAALDSLAGEIRPRFEGENVVLGVHDQERLVGFCWCVFYDPGSGYEAEVAEVYVAPSHRGRGLARRLLADAVSLINARGATFASVWTHPDNAAAVSLYSSAGFSPTEQLVMTWLPRS